MRSSPRGHRKAVAAAFLVAAILAVTGPIDHHHAVAQQPRGKNGAGRAAVHRFLLNEGITECGSSAAPVASGQTFECDYLTTAPIPAGVGVDFTFTIIQPPGTLIAAYIDATPPLPAGCTPAVVAGVFTISGCAAPVPAGTLLQFSVLGGGTPGVITASATYGAGPAVTGITFQYQVDLGSPPGPAAVVSNSSSSATPSSITCANTAPGKAPNAPFAPGDTFACTVALNGANTAASAALRTRVPAPTGREES